MTDVAAKGTELGAESEGTLRTCLCESFARGTERASLASARWLGRADETAALEAATSGMLEALEQLPIDGTVVIGAAGEGERLQTGVKLGAGGAEVELAVDPLEGSGIVARGGSGAMSMIAVGEPGSLQTLPDMYMRKMAVGPVARGNIDLRRPVGENIEAIAEAFGRRVGDITTIVLERPRHHDLIEEIRAAGARIKLIQDGDVTASISAAIRGTNDHLAIGIGGTRQAVLTAAALRCLGAGRSTRRASRGSRTSSASSRPMISPRRRRSSAPPGFQTATSSAASASAPTAPGRTRSSCAPAATGCASPRASTSSSASVGRRFGSPASRGTLNPWP